MQVLALNPEILVRFVAAVKQRLLTCKAAAVVAAELQAERVSHLHLVSNPGIAVRPCTTEPY